MALEDSIVQGVNLTASDIAESLSAVPGVSVLIKIGQIAGILIILYFGFLIVKMIFQIKYAISMKKLNKNVEEINTKIGKLLANKNK